MSVPKVGLWPIVLTAALSAFLTIQLKAQNSEATYGRTVEPRGYGQFKEKQMKPNINRTVAVSIVFWAVLIGCVVWFTATYGR
jgi:hypothetical protein